MQFRTGASASALRMLDGDREVGRIEGGTVRFSAFPTPSAAADAAQTAIRALSRRRSRSLPPEAPEELVLASHADGQYLIGRSSLLARLVPPEAGDAQWGFEVGLRYDEQTPVFAMSRARTMWHAIRAAGLAGVSNPLDPGPAAESAALAAGGA
jgi:hypothetical protein